jgi:hypothetical protein
MATKSNGFRTRTAREGVVSDNVAIGLGLKLLDQGVMTMGFFSGLPLRVLFTLALIALAPSAIAQLIDPNNHCVYMPGSTQCQPIQKPAPPQVSGPPYDQFLDLVRRSNINIEDHPTYSQGYFETRAQTYCELLQQGEMMKLTQEITFPPVVNWSETTNDRPRLETAILRIGTLNYCNAHWSQERQWEATFTR